MEKLKIRLEDFVSELEEVAEVSDTEKKMNINFYLHHFSRDEAEPLAENLTNTFEGKKEENEDNGTKWFRIDCKERDKVNAHFSIFFEEEEE